MPTLKPRITITLEPHFAKLLDELAFLQERSKGEILGELFETVREPFERVAIILRAAKNAPAETLARFRTQLDAVEAAVVPAGAASMAQMDFLIHSIGSGAPERPQRSEDVQAHQSRPRHASKTPARGTPPSNRGVTPPHVPHQGARKVTSITAGKGRGGKK